MYRSRVRKVSPSYGSQSVVQLPEQHMTCNVSGERATESGRRESNPRSQLGKPRRRYMPGSSP